MKTDDRRSFVVRASARDRPGYAVLDVTRAAVAWLLCHWPVELIDSDDDESSVCGRLASR